MNELNERLLKELPDFKNKGKQFLAKEITKSDFKKISGGLGVYAQRDGQSFIIRFRIPGGIISQKELQFVYDMALKHNLDSIHLTTRQCIQLNGLSLDSTCEVIEQGIHVGLYTRGSGGNYPRNVAMSPLTGLTDNEAFDVLPFAIAANLHLLKRIYTYKLPRKFKVSFSNNEEATVHSTVQDLGFIATWCDDKPFFKVYLGGSLGKDPRCSVVLSQLLSPNDALYAIEGLIALFVKEGNYENHHQARIRYIIEKLGEEQFISRYLEEFEQAKHSQNLTLSFEPTYETYEDWSATLIHPRIVKQKQKGFYSMYFQPIGGQLSLNLLNRINQKLESMPHVQLRLTMTEGIYFINLDEQQALQLLELTDSLGGETALAQSVSCIGVPTCQIGIQNSQETLHSIVSYFNDKKYKKDILPRVYISGCPNSCGVHQIGSIGLMGKKKKLGGVLTDTFTLYIGGSFNAHHTRLGTPIGDVTKDSVPECLYTLALEVEKDGEDFDTWLNKNHDHLPSLLSTYLV